MAPQPPDTTLLEAQDRFIAAWGQMGAAWGISRTMAEVHALLFITGEPLNTDDIMERLQISRGNASMSLRALLEWGIVFRTHKRGERKEYYTAEQDVWALIRAIVRERMKREVDPLLASLFEIRDMTSPARAQTATASPDEARALNEHNQRLDALLEFLQTLEKLSQRFASPSGRGLRLAATVLNKVS
jgi:HTH-type transcriptional regulator, glycine betaine synthesis regulator